MTSESSGVKIGGALLPKLGMRKGDKARKGIQPVEATNVVRKTNTKISAAKKVPGVT
ncbi:hypothetical protein ANO14919_130400 [Xylariales sp. No.14919]|nr:hypothetical protein ANO14919_130400 [Xylariales sp. No.14919]